MNIKLIFKVIGITFLSLVIFNSCKVVEQTNNPGGSAQYILTVNVGTGVTGSPVTGSFTYTAGTVVNYNYSLVNSSYSNLQVTLNGTAVAPSGTINMNGNYSLVASADITTATYDVRGFWKGWAKDSTNDTDPFEITFAGSSALSGTTNGWVNSPTQTGNGTYSVSGTSIEFDLWYGSVRNFQMSGNFNGATNITGNWVWTASDGQEYLGTFNITKQ